MDATTLRIVLFVLGCIFLVGIYLYETNRQKNKVAQARRRKAEMMRSSQAPVPLPAEAVVEEMDQPQASAPIASPEGDDTWINWEDEDDTELLDRGMEEIGSVEAEDDEAPELDLTAESEAAPMEPEQQDLFGFSAQEESPVDVPVLIIQINLRARSAPFRGPEIQKAMYDTGLVMNELSIYQRLTSDGSDKPTFNLASMVEPGVFPKQDVEAFSTPGLTLFTQLPGPGDSLGIFADMLFTAERLAAILDGELQDDTHSALTKQTIEHMRGEIMEHRRQVQLARSKG
ncbi:MAG: cell division protein ZipA [gamma proteobacterium symbiont of Ctena orbiculata]|uniref:Cell division protein ZipA n=1 Tax=Candidatus Thiodiazotropha taylori TaxID=2792791 RepID=A0A944MAA1_9GAMM|nr:cell division protein ZipA [Candidatus Thiodiazotropha taylori]MBV2138521.1 cell division protein ZipA [Candidatus Thiodiazotropha taylori]PVV13457.1 MAG: cell division protein ZipA [gamma proteobacterium symbiont of Ctena orbiculata]PVV14501.1 MAG: cell division protein ZipA [gamma proteobacterium symbiont of Ctena orbiculata]PVV20072.1 MAG: cell division protein ZipA [gamma proteobacterium symbiont of Ctena orbiculata]